MRAVRDWQKQLKVDTRSKCLRGSVEWGVRKYRDWWRTQFKPKGHKIYTSEALRRLRPREAGI